MIRNYYNRENISLRDKIFSLDYYLILLVIQAWFGSIVVASNLVPWTISVHLFLALLIITSIIIIKKFLK